MSKILVSDLYGTLVPGWSEEMEYFYGYGVNAGKKSMMELFQDNEYYEELIDRVYLHLANYLEAYLSEGNYLYLVTASDSHDGADFLFNNIISRFCKYNKKYLNQIFVFMSGVIDNDEEYRNLSKVSMITVRDGVTYAESLDGICAVLLSNKPEVFDFVKKAHDLSRDQLYAIGDNWKDVPMLLECINLGGKSSFINNGIYRDNPSTEEILHKIARCNFKLSMEEISTMSFDEQTKILLNKGSNGWYYVELKRLYDALYSGQLNLDDLIKKEDVYSILSLYNDMCKMFHENESVVINDKLLGNLPVYPTFVDYSSKVLVRK